MNLYRFTHNDGRVGNSPYSTWDAIVQAMGRNSANELPFFEQMDWKPGDGEEVHSFAELVFEDTNEVLGVVERLCQ